MFNLINNIIKIYYGVCLVNLISNEHRMNIGWKSDGQRLGSDWAATEQRLSNS